MQAIKRATPTPALVDVLRFGYSKVAGPLTDLTGKKVPTPFRLPPKAVEPSQFLKDAFTRAPLLAHFNPDTVCVVETDASGFAISAILSQRQNDTHRDPVVEGILRGCAA